MPDDANEMQRVEKTVEKKPIIPAPHQVEESSVETTKITQEPQQDTVTERTVTEKSTE